jgi:hypothetical protein
MIGAELRDWIAAQLREHRRATIAGCYIAGLASGTDVRVHSSRDVVAARAADVANAVMAALEARP